MKTLKKLFSVSAIVALLGTLIPMHAFAANYSDELQDAYNYAYAHGITTMKTIDAADMYGSLTRVAMAKMIANYATTVLGLEPNTSAKCSFSDVTAALDAQYDNGVTKACQLGLMGQNITAFRPNDLVTRAEFGTTLSRALNANSDDLASMNAANPYYKDHLNFLKSEGVMNQIDNPSMTEVRGYVMLMMMRADENYTPVEGCTAEELLACITADDFDACTAACSDEGEENNDPKEVKAGTLNVTMTSEKGGDIPNKVSSLPVATYTLKATDEDVNVTSLVVKQGGYGDEDTIAGAALYINGQRVSKVKDLDLSKEVTLNLTTAYTIKAGKSVDIELRINNESTTSSQFTLELIDVNSSAEKVKLPSNKISNTFKFVGTETATLTVSKTSSLESPKAGTKDAELFEIKIEQTSGEAQDVKINSLTLLANNKDLADYLENIELVVDNDVIAKGTMNGKYLTFVLNNPYTLEKNKKVTFTVKGDVVGGAGEGTFNFSLESIMDLSATATSYNAPVAIKETVTFSDFTVKAGRVTIERENPSTTTFTKNRTNLYLGSFTIKNNAGGSLYLQDFTLDVTGNVEVIDSLKVRYGSTSAGLIELDSNYKDDTETSIGSKLSVYVYADIKNVDVDGKNFKVSLSGINIEDADDNKLSSEDISMPASWLQMKGTASALNITKVNLADKSFAKGVEDIDAVSFKVKTNNVDGVKIKKIIFSGNVAVNTNTVRNAKLYVGNDEYVATVQNGTIKTTNTINLAANTTTTFTLKVSLTSNPTITDGFKYILTEIEAEDTSADRNDLSDTGYSIEGRLISVAQNGQLSVTMENTENNKYAKSILAGTSGVVAEYQLKTTYEDINIDKIELEFTESVLARVSDVELIYGNQAITNALISGTKATFDNIDLDVTTTKTPLSVKLITKTIDSDNGTGVLQNVSLSGIVFSDMVGKDTGNPIDDKVFGTNSKEFDIVPAIIVASVISSNNSQTKVNLNVNKGDNELDNTDLIVTLSGLVMEEVGGNGSLTGDKWTVTNPDNSTGSYQLAEGDNEFTVTYVVSSTANNLSYTVNLKDVQYSTNATSDVLSNRMQVLQLVSR